MLRDLEAMSQIMHFSDSKSKVLIQKNGELNWNGGEMNSPEVTISCYLHVNRCSVNLCKYIPGNSVLFN